MSSTCAAPVSPLIFSIGHHLLEQMTILLLLRRRIDQARIRRRILRLEFFDGLEVARVGDDDGELLQLLELAQFGFRFFPDRQWQ